MKTTIVLFTALAASSFLPAQDPKAPPQMPNPKVKEHEALKTLTGDWQCTCKMNAMPGVAGRETASETTATEKSELVCNGLWVKSTVDGTYQGKPFQGVWLVGYDPTAKGYKSIWISSLDEAPSVDDATFDEKTRTWTFIGANKHGKTRSVYTMKDADNAVETCYLVPPGGKETETMVITRTRSKGAAPADALAKVAKEAPKTLPKELTLLADTTGKWDALVTSTMPGQTAPTTEKGTETVTSICNGKWTWSDFRGVMMGQPFEGHGLMGWDPEKKQYVGFWIDSCSPTHAMTTGTYDEQKKAITSTGSCLCPEGKNVAIEQTWTQPDANTRNVEMAFRDAEGTHRMKIAYTRAKS
jgi:hypothetical protein